MARHPADGRQGRRAAPDACRRACPSCRAATDPSPPLDEARRVAAGDRLSGHAQGRRGRRRHRHGQGRRRGRARAGVRDGGAPGAGGLRLGRALRRALPDRAPAHRGPGLRRRAAGRWSTCTSASARSSGAIRSLSRRARRRGSVARPQGAADARRRSTGARSVGLRQCRDHGVHRPGRGVLLPRDEHAAPGRASRDRGGDGARHRPGPAEGGVRRAAAVAPGRHRPARRRHRVPDLRRGPGQELHAFAGDDHPLGAPHGPGIRVESGVAEGCQVSVHYDPLLAKLVATGATREEAIARMQAALEAFVVEGPKTTIPFHLRVMASAAFREGRTHTQMVEQGAFNG